jgi:glycine betaine/choline ABC-type transport system substrate-binding protein
MTVGSFDFPDSVLGTRELVDQALINGLIQLFPGYAGSALDFMSRGRRVRALILGGRGVR